MKVLIVLLGRSVWGVVNSIWASARNYNYVPDKVYLIALRKNRMNLLIASDMIKIVLNNFGKKIEIITDVVEGGDMKGISSKVGELVEGSFLNGDTISIDVTSASKDLALSSTIPIRKDHLEHIFYLGIESLNNVDHPYLFIPVEIQHPHDILKETVL